MFFLGVAYKHVVHARMLQLTQIPCKQRMCEKFMCNFVKP